MAQVCASFSRLMTTIPISGLMGLCTNDLNKQNISEDGKAILFNNIGKSYSDLGLIDKAIRYFNRALSNKPESEAIAFANLGSSYSILGQMDEAIKFCRRAIRIADRICSVQIQNGARYTLACEFLFALDLTQARSTAEAARKYDYPKNNHNISALLGIIALRQKDIQCARQSFHDAVSQADHILNQTPQFYNALYAKALAFAGLAVCENPQNKSQEYVESAKAAFRQARVICSAKGVVSRTLKLFDALAAADEAGILAGVREAAGEK